MHLREVPALVAAVLGILSATPAASEIRIPDCLGIVTWAAKAHAADSALMRSAGQQQLRSGAWLPSGYKDEHWEPVFGTPFPDTAPADFASLAKTAEACRLQARAQFRQLQRGSPQYNALVNADQYLLLLFRGRPPATPQAAAQLQAPFKAAYERYASGLAAAAKQRQELETLAPSPDSIARLEAMKKEPALTSLGPDRAGHLALLDRAAIEFADRIVMAAIDRIADFPETLAGLRALIAYRAETAAKIGTLKSRKWQAFGTAYSERLNALGEAALPAFVAELQAAPADAGGKAAVQAAIDGLFPRGSSPRNMRDYRKAAAQRLAEIDTAIKTAACDATLAKHDLGSEADTPLLGPGGETSLGAFLCAVTDTGLGILEYNKPGWLGSTYELVLQIPSGPSLGIDMKLVEAVKGRPEMLVGTRVKEPTGERELTVAAWQDLAAGYSGYNPSDRLKSVLLPLAQAKLDRMPQGCVQTINLQNVTAFPVTINAGALDRDTVRQFALLGALGLVSIEEQASQNRSYRTYRYTLTPTGERYHKGKDGLCFAEFTAEEIGDISEPFQRGGRTFVTAVLAATPKLPDFALDPRFLQAVAGPQQGVLRNLVSTARSGQASRAKVAFVATEDGGWQPAD